MSESSQSNHPFPFWNNIARVRTWPGAAILAILLIFLLEIFLHLNRHRLVDGIEANLIAKRQLLEDSDAPADDIAIFGDSKLFSVRPSAVAQAMAPAFAVTGSNKTTLPLRVTNYTWPFMGMEAYDAILANYLRHRQAPRVIIVGARSELVGLPAQRNSMADNPAHRARAFIALPLRQLIASALVDHQPGLLWHRLEWAMLPPSTAYREEAAPALKDLVRGRGWPEPDKDYRRLTTDYHRTGAFLMHRNRQVSYHDVIALEQTEGPYAVYQNHRQATSFERFLSRANGAGIIVLMLGVPQPPPYHQRFKEVGILDAYSAVLGHWEKQYPNFRVLQPLYPVRPLDQFGDAGHINTAGDFQFQSYYQRVLADAARLL